MAAQSKNLRRGLSVTLDYVHGEMAQLEVWYAGANKDLKNHNEEFLKLGHVTKIHRKKSFNFEQKTFMLEVELRASRE